MLNKKTKLTMSKKSKAKLFCLTIALQLFAVVAFAQDITVRGRVTDEKGAAIEGASVVVKGTKAGTSTDAAGNYSISAAMGSTLVISSVNFAPTELKVRSATQNVTLTSPEKSLGDIVVI